MQSKLSNHIIGHELWIASNAYIQQVTCISMDEDNKNDEEVLIGSLGGLHLFGRKYPSGTLPKTSFIRDYKKGMWIKYRHNFYEVGGIHSTMDDANRQLENDHQLGFIDEVLNETGDALNLYLNASIKPASLNN